MYELYRDNVNYIKKIMENIMVKPKKQYKESLFGNLNELKVFFYYNLTMARIRSKLNYKSKNKTSFKPEKIIRGYGNEFRIYIRLI